MSVKDMIKKSVLESGVFDQYNIPEMLTALIAALLFGVLIYAVYRKFYAGVIYSRSFAVTLVGMTVLTCMVTLAISTNVVILSLIHIYLRWQTTGSWNSHGSFQGASLTAICRWRLSRS